MQAAAAPAAESPGEPSSAALHVNGALAATGGQAALEGAPGAGNAPNCCLQVAALTSCQGVWK